MYSRELLRGSTDTLLLSLLVQEAMYGYQIVKEIDRRSEGYFRFKEGTLYPALHRMERDGLLLGQWAEAPSGQQRRYYSMTEKGRRTFELMIKEWNLFSRAVNSVALAGTS